MHLLSTLLKEMLRILLNLPILAVWQLWVWSDSSHHQSERDEQNKGLQCSMVAYGESCNNNQLEKVGKLWQSVNCARHLVNACFLSLLAVVRCRRLWKWGGCVPEWEQKVVFLAPCCHLGEFLCKRPQPILNAWDRLKSSYLIDYFSLTAGDNEVKIVSQWTLRRTQEERNFMESSQLSALTRPVLTSAIYMGGEGRLNGFMVQSNLVMI